MDNVLNAETWLFGEVGQAFYHQNNQFFKVSVRDETPMPCRPQEMNILYDACLDAPIYLPYAVPPEQLSDMLWLEYEKHTTLEFLLDGMDATLDKDLRIDCIRDVEETCEENPEVYQFLRHRFLSRLLPKEADVSHAIQYAKTAKVKELYQEALADAQIVEALQKFEQTFTSATPPSEASDSNELDQVKMNELKKYREMLDPLKKYREMLDPLKKYREMLDPLKKYREMPDQLEDEASKVYQQTIAQCPDNVVARNKLAEILIKSQQVEEARQLLSTQVAQLQTRVDWIGFRIYAMSFAREGRWDEAVIHLKQGVKDAPVGDKSYFRNSLAFAQLQRGLFADSLQTLHESADEMSLLEQPVAQLIEADVYAEQAVAATDDTQRQHYQQQAEQRLQNLQARPLTAWLQRAVNQLIESYHLFKNRLITAITPEQRQAANDAIFDVLLAA